MSAHVASRALHDRRRGLLGWSIGIGLYVAMIVAVWPSIRGAEQLKAAIDDYPKALKELFGGASSFDFSTPGGYLNAELFSLMVPLLLGVFAIGFGASTLAGEQERGVLDLILVNPLRRRRVVLEKALSLATGVVALAAAAAVVIAVAGVAAGMHLGTSRLVAAIAGAALLCVLHGYVALLVGAATGSRAAAIGVSASVFTAGYLLQALAGLVAWLRPLRVFSPFYLYNGSMPITHGFALGHDAVLLALCVAALVAAVAVFERRDLPG